MVQFDSVWANVNFKETQLKKMRVGQRVTIDAGSLGESFEGQIEIIQFTSEFLAATLELMSNRVENITLPEHHDLRGTFELLERAVRACCMEGPHHSIAIELKTFLALSQNAEDLVTSLANKVSGDSASFTYVNDEDPLASK